MTLTSKLGSKVRIALKIMYDQPLAYELWERIMALGILWTIKVYF